MITMRNVLRCTIFNLLVNMQGLPLLREHDAVNVSVVNIYSNGRCATVGNVLYYYLSRFCANQ